MSWRRRFGVMQCKGSGDTVERRWDMGTRYWVLPPAKATCKVCGKVVRVLPGYAGVRAEPRTGKLVQHSRPRKRRGHG